ncbi:GABA-b receptor [Plakobranchus ocellatus]|uniref:GABA-b receptor n=1 Tax=Plakobranchus ocellatus TaxID=259542 RepID=A0AAV3ZYE2_9GAST|nr:GABA-b receptor [Plakobranchus ocellatus]
MVLCGCSSVSTFVAAQAAKVVNISRAQQFTELLNTMIDTTDTSSITGYPESPLAYDDIWTIAFAFHTAAAT